MMQVAMVAGEPSGDLLAQSVIQGIQQQAPQTTFTGIGGPHMQAQGFKSWYPLDNLSIFGYADALKRAPTLVRTFYGSLRRWQRTPPQVYVGIDAPDFNLRMAKRLRRHGVPTLQFVGPSVWAWRYERIYSIAEAVSRMLVLFPFEVAVYQKEGIEARCVGHPLAQKIPLQPDQAAARARLKLQSDTPVLALLPGSRRSEIALLAPRFLQAVQLLQHDLPHLQVVVPMVNAQRKAEFLAIAQRYTIHNMRLLEAPSDIDRPVAWEAMEAADALLVASGTATLEGLLFKRPMVISYVLSPLMKKLMAWQSGQQRPLMDWVGLPNILAQQSVVPELLQDAATPQNLAAETHKALTDQQWGHSIQQQFLTIHQSLRLDTPRLVADAVLELAHAS